MKERYDDQFYSYLQAMRFMISCWIDGRRASFPVRINKNLNRGFPRWMVEHD